MKRIAVVLSLMLLVMFVISVQTQNQVPTPPPEMKALEVWIGEWTYEGEAKESPMGPAGKFKGKQTVNWILNGFFQEEKYIEKGNLGDFEVVEIHCYDATTKKYPYMWYANDGSWCSGTQTVSGNIWNCTQVIYHNGNQYKARGIITFASDGMSWTNKAEISPDGKTWNPWFEVKNTKVKPAK